MHQIQHKQNTTHKERKKERCSIMLQNIVTWMSLCIPVAHNGVALQIMAAVV